MHASRACHTTFGAGALLFVLRNSLGTSNVPNLLCRAKTLWSCIEGDAGLSPESVVLCVMYALKRELKMRRTWAGSLGGADMGRMERGVVIARESGLGAPAFYLC